MEKLEFALVGESMYHEKLANGLNVFVFPKPDFQKGYAFFAANYGGMDMRFCLNGEWHSTPAGVAHYLEHKMFDTQEGNALQELAANGASPNAFTSNDITGYYFDSTEKFEENLRILLSFVSVPWFTQESVDKERGIIGQEIGMIEDDPEWKCFINLMAALYRHHPIRVSVAGSVESIAKITPETLYACHKAFYDPANMVLCVAGPVDPAHICAVAREILPGEAGPISYPYPPQMEQPQQAAPDPKVISTKPLSMGPLDPVDQLGQEQAKNLDLIMEVPLQVTVEIGRARRKVQDILEFAKGSLVVLDKLAGDQVDLFVNGKIIARGEVVVIEDNFGVRITEIVQTPGIEVLASKAKVD